MGKLARCLRKKKISFFPSRPHLKFHQLVANPLGSSYQLTRAGFNFFPTHVPKRLKCKIHSNSIIKPINSKSELFFFFLFFFFRCFDAHATCRGDQYPLSVAPISVAWQECVGFNLFIYFDLRSRCGVPSSTKKKYKKDIKNRVNFAWCYKKSKLVWRGEFFLFG